MSNRLTAVGTFATKDDANAALVAAVSAQQRGAWVRPDAGRVTLAAWVEDEWWPTKEGLRSKTLIFYRTIVDNYILPELGSMPLASIDTPTVRRWLANLRARGLSPTSVRHAHSTLHNVFGLAVEARRVAVNPCVARLPTIDDAAKQRWPSPSEVLALSKAVPSRYRAMVLTAGFVGLRWGEIVALRRRNVDLEQRTIRVVEQVTEHGSQRFAGPPKTGAGVRTVAVPSFVADTLARHLDDLPPLAADDLVFPAPRGGWLSRAHFGRVWRTARASVGLDDVAFHSLRHTAATVAAQSGASTSELMARIGHSSPRAALIYQHATEERDHEIASRVDDLVRRQLASESGTSVARDTESGGVDAPGNDR